LLIAILVVEILVLLYLRERFSKTTEQLAELALAVNDKNKIFAECVAEYTEYCRQLYDAKKAADEAGHRVTDKWVKPDIGWINLEFPNDWCYRTKLDKVKRAIRMWEGS
jgi:hypothetical protein